MKTTSQHLSYQILIYRSTSPTAPLNSKVYRSQKVASKVASKYVLAIDDGSVIDPEFSYFEICQKID